MDQKFYGDDEKTRESRFWELTQWLTAIICPKSQISNIRFDGILSIGNFMLMINYHFAHVQLPAKYKKNLLPISLATRNFLFIYCWLNDITDVSKKCFFKVLTADD
jgi:hypothetical protein